MSADRIFGDLPQPEKLLAHHLTTVTGVKHLHRLEPRKPAPGQAFAVLLSTTGPQPFTAARCWYTAETPEGTPSQGTRELELTLAKTTWDDLSWGYIQLWTGHLPAFDAGTMVRYRLGAQLTGSSHWVFADNQATALEQATEFAIWLDENGVPDWARSAVVYHIFMDRFNPGGGRAWLPAKSVSDFYGGTIQGIIEKLDYIQDLGCNTIWLSPFFASPSHHGYDATDYFNVEPRLGTNADMQALIAAVHARGMHILLDFVANHWSHQHATFQEARRNRDSVYHDWYRWRNWPDDYETYFGVRELPQLNISQRGPARDYLLECAQYWLIQGFDGFRLDYAYGPSHDFWTDFRRACRTVKPDCWLFVEVIHTASFQLTYAGRVDGALDFLLAQALRETFGDGSWTLAQFEAFLAAHEAYFPSWFVRPAFLDNHDMNRFLYLAGDDPRKLQLGALVLFTLSEPPILYNGTEAGVTQERPIHQNDFGIFEEARLPMKWGAEANADLLAYFKQLIHLRQEHRVLREGTRRVLHLDNTTGTYAYVREVANERVLVALNISTTPQTLTLPLTGLPVTAKDHLQGHAVSVTPEGITLTLRPQGGAFVA